MTGDSFDESMDGTDWEAMYERQAARSGDLARRFCALLGAGAGDRVLELGSGPGYTTARLAEEVAPGPVYALDRRPGALRYLRDVVEESMPIHPVAGDVTALPACFAEPVPTLAAFLLHHVDEPGVAIEGIGSALPPGSPLLVAEYAPGAAGDVGPPLDHRLEPAQVSDWLRGAGFAVEEHVALPEEKYAVLARLTDQCPG